MRRYSFPMRYFVYLKRSLTRAWRSHLLLILLLAFVLALPMEVSILRASYQHGDTLQAEFVSGGHHIGIHNAQPGDEAYFADLPGGTAVWENGKLYIDRNPSSHMVKYGDENFSEGDPLHRVVGERIRMVPHYLIVEYYENYFSERVDYAVPMELLYAVGAFSACILCFTYGVYWHRNGGEMRKLQSVGASGGQILSLSFVHMLLVQSVAVLLAVLISVGTLYFLTNRYLVLYRTGTQRHASNSNLWMAFDVNPSQLLACIGIAFGSAVLFFLLWHTVELCTYSLSLQQKTLHPLGKIRFAKQARRMLTAVFLRRGTVSLFFCLLIAVPLVLSSVLLIQLRQNPEEEAASTSTMGGIRVAVDMRFFPGFTEENLAYFENLEGVDHVEPQFSKENYGYHLRDDRGQNEYWTKVYGMGKGFYAELIKSGDVEGKVEIDENGEKIYNIVYYPGRSDAVYAVGDILTLYVTGGEKTTKVRVTDILAEETAYDRLLTYYDGDESWARGAIGAVYLFCSGSDLREMTEHEYCNSFRIYLTHVSYNTSVEEAIFDYFTPEELGLYLNNYTDKEVAYNRAVGMNLLYTTLSALLFLFFATITTLSLIDYAASHRETLRLLHMQGASHRAIIAAFVEILLPPAILTCAAVWAIVTPVEREYYRLRGYTDALMAKMDLRMIDDPRYLLAAVAVVAVFVAPAVVTVARELRKLERM